MKLGTGRIITLSSVSRRSDCRKAVGPLEQGRQSRRQIWKYGIQGPMLRILILEYMLLTQISILLPKKQSSCEVATVKL